MSAPSPAPQATEADRRLAELRARPHTIDVAEMPHWLRIYADALCSNIEPNPTTVADYLARAASELDAARARIEELERQVRERDEALQPFADFADPKSRIPSEMVITSGSTMARRQLAMGHCYRARDVLKRSTPHA